MEFRDPQNNLEQIWERVVSDCIRYTTSRAGGKGGQNVNKVETRVELFLDVHNCKAFSDESCNRILSKFKNAQGIIRIVSSEHRTQLANKKACLRKLKTKLEIAFADSPERKATKPTRGAKEERLQAKKQTGAIKRTRKPPEIE